MTWFSLRAALLRALPALCVLACTTHSDPEAQSEVDDVLPGDGDGDGDTLPPSCAEPNACGGCETLSAAPGSACGSCGTGQWTCSGADEVRCDDAAGESCGCDELTGTPCGECGSGTWLCDDGESVCSGDLGTLARNACGGCGALANAPAEVCGACNLGRYVCSGEDDVLCSATQADELACSECAEHAGTPCGVCESGRIACDESGVAHCEGDLGEVALNACAGCGTLPAEPGSPCGPCGFDRFVCDAEGGVVCNGATPANDCGGCAPSSAKQGESCGGSLCGGGVWTCDDDAKTPVCRGEGDFNACGGCEELGEVLGAPCGPCGLDSWVCDGSGGLRCSGTTARNGCGGCEVLEHELGSTCDGADTDTCQDDTYECQGKDALACAHGADSCRERACPNLNLTIATDQDVQALADTGCTSLGWVSVYGQGVTSLAGFERVTSIGTLDIRDVPNLRSLEGLEGLTTVTDLFVQILPQLHSLEGLRSLRRASILVLGVLPVSSLEGLSSLTSVQSLTLSALPELTSLLGLSKLKSAGSITFRDLSKLHSLEGLSGLQTLSRLTLGGSADPHVTGRVDASAFDSLRGLDSLVTLRTLTIEGQQHLKNLDALPPVELNSVWIARNPALETVIANGAFTESNGAAKLFSLADCAKLTRVSLPGFLGTVARVLVERMPKLQSVELGKIDNVRGDYVFDNLPLLRALPGQPREIGGSLHVVGLKVLAGLDGLGELATVRGTVELTYLPGLSSVALPLLSSVGGKLEIGYTGLRHVSGLGKLAQVSDNLSVYNNPDLAELDDFVALAKVGGILAITDNPKLPSCRALSVAERLRGAGALANPAVVRDNAPASACP